MIEDLIPLYEIPVRVKNMGRKIKRVYLAPTGEEVPFETDDGGNVAFVIPKVDLPALAVLEYEA